MLRENKEITQNLETGIHNIIIQCKKDGKSKDETGVYIGGIFVLTEEGAEEKVRRYWEG